MLRLSTASLRPLVCAEAILALCVVSFLNAVARIAEDAQSCRLLRPKGSLLQRPSISCSPTTRGQFRARVSYVDTRALPSLPPVG
jgi:hypothetical protein